MPGSSLVISLALVGLFSIPSPAQDLDPQTLKRGIESTVFIKSERVFRGLYFPSFGTGFFVHPDGIVLTNWHVVADQIEARIYGQETEITTEVLSLDVVINSGQPNEVVVPAKIIARDRERDLALLQVKVRPAAWVPVTSPPEPTLAQAVWLVGYPLGNMLGTDMDEGSTTSEEIPNPSASINRGMITSMRRDATGKLKALQIDAAVNPGNSGGPLFDNQGRVIGVVNSKIMFAEGLGFAISPTLLREFAARKSAHITFEPNSIYRTPARPLRITVQPLLTDLENSHGTVQIQGEGMAPITLAMEKNGSLWSVEIPIPDRGPDDPDPDDYFVDIDFVLADNSVAMQRKIRIKSATAGLNLHSQRNAGRMLQDRRLFSNEMEISDYTKSGSVSGKDTRSLADVARDLKLNRSSSGSVVIDNRTLDQVNSSLERQFPSERYSQIATKNYQALARDYDLANWQRNEIASRLRMLKNFEDDPDYRTRNAASETARKLRKRQPQVEQDFLILQQRIRQAKLVFCHDREKWYFSHSFPCEAPEVP